MSSKQEYQLKKWECLIKDYQESGMRVTDWCVANNVSKDQYYYWIRKVRLKYYETAVKQLKTTETGSDDFVPEQVTQSSFVEINPDIIGKVTKPVNLPAVNPHTEKQPAENLQTAILPCAVVKKGSLRVEIMQSASSSFIRQILEAVYYA